MTIISPDDDGLDKLCARLAETTADVDLNDAWPAEQLRLCGAAGVYEWFLPKAWGGQQWSDLDLMRGYLRLSAACLATTFVITQLTGACRRIAADGSDKLRDRLLPDLLTGKTFTTLGISHLTTSHRHQGRPALRATATDGGFVLDGFSPWVTGGPHAQTIVTGATLDDGRQILLALPTELPGVTAGEPVEMVALTASHTGPVHCESVEVSSEWLLAGPSENVIAGATGASTGGLQTSTLALGVASAAIEYLEQEAERRPDLLVPLGGLRADLQEVKTDLLQTAAGEEVCTNEQLRTRANSLVLRSTQAALAAAKGAGYVNGHPAGRWCREALFFLVWSCPQPVLAANLCELAGLTD
jgi:alkylation response protein AidB-like acyl-CoA dehydrogenase